MSGGKHIEDHAFWAGRPGKGMVMPEGAKHKEEHSAEGGGRLSKYEDTTEAIRATQMHQDAKMRSKPMKDGDRN